MFILDIQGDQKGLSIGGLVVVTKSLSITVRPLFYWCFFVLVFFNDIKYPWQEQDVINEAHVKTDRV